MILSAFQPRVLVVAYRRSYDALKDVGRNVSVAWKPDSTALAVTVSRHALVVSTCNMTSQGRPRVLGIQYTL